MEKFIPIAEPNIGPKEIEYVNQAVSSGWVSSLGEFVERFETNFAAYCGREHGVSVSNGTVALHLALMALGIGKGDEVIVPNFAFVATVNAVLYAGATPVLADVEAETLNLDASKLAEKITQKTKAVIVVHTYGHPADMDAIMAIAKQHNLRVIEDAAEAHGAEYKGKKVGGFGDISCFSFYGNKTITTGEGGMCLVDDEELWKTMLLLRDHGMRKEKKYWHEVVGYNYRLTNLQAALGCAQLERLEEFVEQKRSNAAQYQSLLKDIPWLTPPVERPYAKNTYWMFTVMLDETKDRNAVVASLKQAGIDSRVSFYPISDMPPYQQYDTAGLEVSKRVAYLGLSLPSSTALSSEDIKRISDVLHSL